MKRWECFKWIIQMASLGLLLAMHLVYAGAMRVSSSPKAKSNKYTLISMKYPTHLNNVRIKKYQKPAFYPIPRVINAPNESSEIVKTISPTKEKAEQKNSLQLPTHPSKRGKFSAILSVIFGGIGSVIALVIMNVKELNLTNPSYPLVFGIGYLMGYFGLMLGMKALYLGTDSKDLAFQGIVSGGFALFFLIIDAILKIIYYITP